MNSSDPVKYYSHDLKHQVMITVWVIVLAIIVLNTVSTTALMCFKLVSSDFRDSIAEIITSAGNDFEMLFWQILLLFLDPDNTPNATGAASIIAVICSLPIFLMLRGKKLLTKDITEIRSPVKPLFILQLFLVAMAAQLIYTLVAAGLNALLEPFGIDITELLNEGMKSLKTPMGLLYGMLIGPICEEIIFRGAVLRSLERFGGNFAIVISSLLFGLYHVFTIQALYAFLLGLILGYAAQRYSLLWAILLHILLNSFATGMDTLPETAGNVIMVGFFVVGIALLILLVRRGVLKEQLVNGKPYQIAVGDTPIPYTPRPFRLAFSTISFIIYFIAVLIIGILMILFL